MILLEGSHASPVRPSDKDNSRMVRNSGSRQGSQDCYFQHSR
jgi:hypothetical protein